MTTYAKCRCPECGSGNITYGTDVIDQFYRCRDCGYYRSGNTISDPLDDLLGYNKEDDMCNHRIEIGDTNKWWEFWK